MSQGDHVQSGQSEVAEVLRAAGLDRLEGNASANFLKLAVFVLLVGGLVRVVLAVLYANVDPATANTWEYGEIAAASLKYGAIVASMRGPNGSVLVFPTAFMPPLPIFIWLGLFSVLGVSAKALSAMIALNVICGTAIIGYTMRIARLLFRSSLVALVAGCVMALHPVFAYSVATYEQLNLYILLLLVIFDLSSSRFRPSLSGAMAVGLLLGMAVLVRTEYLVLGVAIVIGGCLRHRRVKLCVLTLAVAFLFAIPWTARNYLVFHRVIPVADSAGYNLFKGFNPEANGSGHWVDNAGVAERMLGSKIAKIPVTRMYEIDVNAVYQAAAEKFIADHPIKSFVVLPAEKVFLFWFFDVHDPTVYRLLYQLQFWPIFLLSVLGLTFAAKERLLRDPDHRMVLIMFGAETLVMAAYAVHARYRMNVEPFLFGYAALGALVAFSWMRARVSRRVARAFT